MAFFLFFFFLKAAATGQPRARVASLSTLRRILHRWAGGAASAVFAIPHAPGESWDKRNEATSPASSGRGSTDHRVFKPWHGVPFFHQFNEAETKKKIFFLGGGGGGGRVFGVFFFFFY